MLLNKRIKAVIIDDEINATLLLEKMLGKIDGVIIAGHATDLNSGVNLVLNHRPDIVFLDIKLNEENGFDLIHLLKDYDIDPFIVIVTGFDQFGLKAIKAGVFDYLLKPVSPDELTKVISRCRQKNARLQQKTTSPPGQLESLHKIRFNTLGGFILVNPDEILYCKARANNTDLFLLDQRKHTISMNIARIEEFLHPPQFFRISRSMLINLKYLTEINRGRRQCTLTANHDSYLLIISYDRINDLEVAFLQ